MGHIHPLFFKGSTTVLLQLRLFVIQKKKKKEKKSRPYQNQSFCCNIVLKDNSIYITEILN